MASEKARDVGALWDGWILSDEGIASPNRSHPKGAPGSRVDEIAPRLRAELDNDPAIQEATRTLLETFAERGRAVFDHLDDQYPDLTDEDLHPAVAAFLESLVPAAWSQAVNVSTPGSTVEGRVIYFVKRVCSELGLKGDPWLPSPVNLIVNINHPGWLIPLHPGEIAMTFTTATQEDRDAYTSLIRQAQEALGYEPNKGGRRRIEDDKVAAEQAKTVAKLAWMGLSTAEIGAFFAWKDKATGDPITPKAVEHRVADYLERGKTLLAREDPEWPDGFAVGRVRRPRRTGLGPPWRG